MKIKMNKADIIASVYIKDWKLHIHVESIQIDSTSLISSNIGDVDAEAIGDTLDLLLDVAVPAINAVIPKIPVPKALSKDIQLKELDFEFHEGYLYFEIGFEQVQAFLQAL